MQQQDARFHQTAKVIGEYDHAFYRIARSIRFQAQGEFSIEFKMLLD